MSKRGRPTKYKKIYAKKIIKYFDIEPNRATTETFYYKNGDEKHKEVEIANNIPTFEGFARLLKVDEATLLRWKDKYKDFRGAYNRAKELQRNIWIINSMKGYYPASYSIFFGKNIFGWKDKQEVDNHLDGGVVINNIKYNE